MSTPLKSGPNLAVVTWPRIIATVNADNTGTLTINGVQRTCAAGSLDALRAGMIARCVTIATALRRPVRLTVTEGEEVWPLAVRPNGIVQALNADGTVDPDDGLIPSDGPCRYCRRPRPVTERFCIQCQTPDPLRVEDTPIKTEDVLSPTQDVEERSLTPDELPRATVPTRVRLTFSDQAPVTITSHAALGRRPEAIGGRQPIVVTSPRRMLSRTHALVDIDDRGQIIVTDHHSGNIQADPTGSIAPAATNDGEFSWGMSADEEDIVASFDALEAERSLSLYVDTCFVPASEIHPALDRLGEILDGMLVNPRQGA